MGAILRFRRRGSIPEFEEVLARLSDELTLTESYTNVLVREGEFETAIAIVDEQRSRVAQAESVMLEALRPERRRTRTVIAGLAAVMMIGSASFAALSSRSPDAEPKAPALLERVERQFDQAAEASDIVEAHRFVTAAIAALNDIDDEDMEDPAIPDQVSKLLNKQIERFSNRPSAEALLQELKDAARKIEAEVEDPGPPPPAPERKAEGERQNPAPTQP